MVRAYDDVWDAYTKVDLSTNFSLICQFELYLAHTLYQ